MTRMIPPPHPGETLREDFLVPLGMSARELARALNLPAPRITDVLRGRRGITADTALRLARFLGTTPDLWMGLQTEYELRMARQAAGKQIEAEVQPRHADAS